MTFLDYLRSMLCWFIGHRFVERPDGMRFCVRCRRHVLLVR